MSFIRRFLSVLLLIALFVATCAEAGALAAGEVTVLFTHDLHSNMLPFTRMDGTAAVQAGGFARLKTALDDERQGADALVVDAGDFSMGTLFQTIYATHASELRMLGALGYDAVTLGNHEFDFQTQGLADMLHAAAASGERLPQLLFDPGDFQVRPNARPSGPLDDLSDAFASVGTAKTIVIEKNGVRIGVFSAFGESAAEYSPTLELNVPKIADSAKQAVAELKEQGAELIVCLSHSGTDPNLKKSEDHLLAAAVPEIDVIVSAHTHTRFYDPVVVGDTVIVACGEYAQHLGKLVLSPADGRWKVQSYLLLPLEDQYAENAEISERIDQFKTVIENEYLTRFGGLKFDQIIGKADFASLRQSDAYDFHAESKLGNFISDAYAAAAGGGELIAVAPAGTMRRGIPRGRFTLAELFNVSSLGVGLDGLSGYPLVDCYITGKEVRTLCEVDASITPIMNDAQLFLSGAQFSFNPNRLIFNKVTDVRLSQPDGTSRQLDDGRLYRVVAGMYSAQMLAAVQGKSFGILAITPKDENGNPIEDFNTRILHDENGEEIKEWYALAQYIASFDAGLDGIPAIPARYDEFQNRKIVETETGIGNYVTHLNGFTWIIYGAAFVLLTLIAFFIMLAATRRRRKERRRERKMARRR